MENNPPTDLDEKKESSTIAGNPDETVNNDGNIVDDNLQPSANANNPDETANNNENIVDDNLQPSANANNVVNSAKKLQTDVHPFVNDPEAFRQIADVVKRRSYTFTTTSAEETKYMDEIIKHFLDNGWCENNNQVLRYLLDIGLHYVEVCKVNGKKVPYYPALPFDKIQPKLLKNSMFESICKLPTF